MTAADKVQSRSSLKRTLSTPNETLNEAEISAERSSASNGQASCDKHIGDNCSLEGQKSMFNNNTKHMPCRIINPKEEKRTASKNENDLIESLRRTFNIDLPEMSLSKRMCTQSEVEYNLWQTPQETMKFFQLYQSNILSHDANIHTSSQSMKKRGQHVSHQERSIDLNMDHKPDSISDTEEFFLDVPRKGQEYYFDNVQESQDKHTDERSRENAHFSYSHQVKPDVFSTPTKQIPKEIIPIIQNRRFLQPRFRLGIRNTNSESATDNAKPRGFFLSLPRKNNALFFEDNSTNNTACGDSPICNTIVRDIRIHPEEKIQGTSVFHTNKVCNSLLYSTGTAPEIMETPILT